MTRSHRTLNKMSDISDRNRKAGKARLCGRPMGALAGPAASPAPAGRPPALATSSFRVGPRRGAGPAGAQAAAPWPRRGRGRAARRRGRRLSGGGIPLPPRLGNNPATRPDLIGPLSGAACAGAGPAAAARAIGRAATRLTTATRLQVLLQEPFFLLRATSSSGGAIKGK